jgi:hypothetical protein
MKNTNTTIKEIAARFYSKNDVQKVEKGENGKIAVLTENMVTCGHVVITTDFDNIEYSGSVRGSIVAENVKRAILPYVENNYTEIGVNFGGYFKNSLFKFYGVGIRGRWASIYSKLTYSELTCKNPDGFELQDGTEIENEHEAAGRIAIDGDSLAKVFKAFKVLKMAVCVNGAHKAAKMECEFKGVRFAVVVLSCGEFDEVEEIAENADKLATQWDSEDLENVVEVTASAPREAVAAMAAPSAPEHDEVPAGVNIRKNEEHDGTEVYFDRKPSQEVRDALKAAGYRWHGVKKCWYGKLSESEVFAIIYGTGERFETSKTIETHFNTEPRDVAKARQLADFLVSSPDEKGKYNMPDHWRKVWKAAGIKGVTVRNRRGGWSYHFTFTFRLLPGDVLPFDECREAMEKTELDDLFRYDAWIKDPDTKENVFRDVFWTWDADKRQRAVSALAREDYERTIEGRTGSICHYWQVKREKYPMFTDQFWDRWELVGRSVSCHNYDNSDPMTDYFDVGFYESWDIVPEKEGAKRDAEGAAMLHAMAEIFRDRDAQAKIEEIEKKEAEDEKRRQEYDKLEEFARESVDVWENESPWAPGCGPSVVVHWSELGALHEGSEDDAGEKGTPAKRYTLQAFDRITDDVDRYVKAHKDTFCYLKVKFTVEFGDELKDYTERIDLGDGDGGLLGMLRNIVKFHEEKGENDTVLVGLYSGRLGYVREVLRRIEENVDDTPYRIENELDGLEMA